MIWIFAFLLQAAVESPREAFQRAEALYQDQSYEAAIEAYEAMRAQGIEDGVLYYNLGNAYFKAGKLGLAVLSYERALRLLPGDEDARTNLAYANELVADAGEPPPLPLAIRWLVDLYRHLEPDFLAWVLSGSFLCGGVAVTIGLTQGGTRWRTPVILCVSIACVLATLSGAALAQKVRARAERVEAIVLTENAYVRSGPGETSPRLAEIHEGLKVRILQEREDWDQVTLSNGLTGWIRRDEIEKI